MEKKTILSLMTFLVFIQAIISLLFPVYQDTGWVKDTWFGNDLVTLVIVVPLLIITICFNKQILNMIQLGCIGYCIYNYLFYALGTGLNKIFLIYILIIVIAIMILLAIMMDEKEILKYSRYYNLKNNYTIPGVILLFIGIGLGSVWILMWINNAYFSKPLPTEMSSFRLVASLDLILIVTPMVYSGIGIIKRKKIAFIIGTITGVQGLLYLLILVVNSTIIAIKNCNFPGEIPIWSILLLIESIGIISLLIIGRKES